MIGLLVLGAISMSASILPYDYADNPVLTLEGNVISWVPYSETSKFDVIKDNREIIQNTLQTSYTIINDGCYWIEDESQYRGMDSTTVCLENGIFTEHPFVMIKPPLILKSETQGNMTIVIWDTQERLSHLNACQQPAKGCFDPNTDTIHVSWETISSLWHEVQHYKGIDLDE